MGEINKESGSLLYNQLAAMLRSDIRSGKYKPSEQIPTEDALCQSYGVSRSTVRKAIAELVGDKLSADYIIPAPFDSAVAPAVAKAVAEAAVKTGVSRK